MAMAETGGHGDLLAGFKSTHDAPSDACRPGKADNDSSLN